MEYKKTPHIVFSKSARNEKSIIYEVLNIIHYPYDFIFFYMYLCLDFSHTITHID